MDLLSGFLVGILGSVHCAGMCGPLALALPVPGGGTLTYVYGRVLYNAGRVLTYAVLGALAGLVGRTLVLAGAQQTVSLILGVLILLSVLVPLALRSLLPSFTLPARFSTYVQAKLAGLMKRSSSLALFLIGVLNGLLPCGFVYVALAAAITTGEVYRGVLFMAGFGLGTGPMMLAIALAGKHIQAGIRRRLVALVPVFTAVLAVLIILRGLNLGIPYISPAVSGKRTPGTATLPLVQFLQQIFQELFHFSHIRPELLVFDLRPRFRRIDQLELFPGVHFGREGLQDLFCPLDGVPLVAQELLDVEDELDVAVGVDAVSRAVLCRLELVELRFPVAQDVLLQVGDLADLADRVVQFLDAERFHDSDPSVGSIRIPAQRCNALVSAAAGPGDLDINVFQSPEFRARRSESPFQFPHPACL